MLIRIKVIYPINFIGKGFLLKDVFHVLPKVVFLFTIPTHLRRLSFEVKVFMENRGYISQNEL